MVVKAAIVCADFATVKLVVTSFAAAWVLSPGWSAARTTVAAPVNVTIFPDIVAGPDFTMTVTPSPELAVGGVMANGASPKVCAGTVAKGAIVCGRPLT